MNADEVREKFEIIESIGSTAVLEQTAEESAEESAELTQAALKVSRILRGVNPTPVTLDRALESLREEVGDVLLCLSVLECAFGRLSSDSGMARKQERWKRRIKESREANGNDL